MSGHHSMAPEPMFGHHHHLTAMEWTSCHRRHLKAMDRIYGLRRYMTVMDRTYGLRRYMTAMDRTYGHLRYMTARNLTAVVPPEVGSPSGSPLVETNTNQSPGAKARMAWMNCDPRLANFLALERGWNFC